jgi:formylglycine-generating enzyme required for sulfatase activity
VKPNPATLGRQDLGLFTAICLLLTCAAQAAPEEAVRVGTLWVDRAEVSISQFRAFTDRSGLATKAERDGGGFEYAGGWVRRPGWTVDRPLGRDAQPHEPAVHVSWDEAASYCSARGGRLPTAAEWREAAFTQASSDSAGRFAKGRTYPFSSGDRPEGLWTAEVSGGRHRRVGSGPPGVNGLHDMGGNVWEWLADRRGPDALTAGGSWWYSARETRADRLQWKSADFFALYIGFRCVYDR